MPLPAASRPCQRHYVFAFQLFICACVCVRIHTGKQQFKCGYAANEVTLTELCTLCEMNSTKVF